MSNDAFVAIDGSKFRAANSRARNLSKGRLKSRLRQIDESIARYLGEIASTDRQEGEAWREVLYTTASAAIYFLPISQACFV